MKLNNLSKYTEIDREKLELIRSAMPETVLREKVFYSKGYIDNEIDYSPDLCLEAPPIDYKLTKVCPKCGKKYPESEIFCFDCAVSLKDIEKVNVRQIDIPHEFNFEGENSYTDFKEILTAENLLELTKFEFEMQDFNEIIRNIKLTAIKNLDSAIKDNEIDLDTLSILEKVILFTKSFVNVEYKSYGQELGFYRFNSIFVDDRQLDALQITTMLHELTHYLIKEILTHILCRLLDASKTKEIESIVTFILSYSSENCLIDEYAAHTVEGRFTLIGYQDYSSFLNIQKTIERSKDEIDMLKTIGNSLANTVKEIVESFIDSDLLEDIKKQFRRDILDEPDYSQLMLENCTLLNDVGFLRAIEFIIVDGFAVSMDNIEKLNQINEMW
ncbi:zinc ribbon domain-containing protein [Methanobrevibacter sp.]|uniref:zinc ribbon domain-containing protein n=1 Tax=Methanobrevibacter sp. TaxID=66852 RepID=UPI0038902613